MNAFVYAMFIFVKMQNCVKWQTDTCFPVQNTQENGPTSDRGNKKRKCRMHNAKCKMILWGSERLFSALLVVGQTRDVVQRNTVEFRQSNGVVEGNFPFAPLIERILLGSNIQHSRNRFLCDIPVFPQIPQSLIIIQRDHLEFGNVLLNCIIQINEYLTKSFE